jgi:hypothetical protein
MKQEEALNKKLIIRREDRQEAREEKTKGHKRVKKN